MARRKTHEEFVAEVEALVGNEYTVVGEYEKASVKILMKHNVCGEQYLAWPAGFVSTGQRCPSCHFKKLGNALRISTDKIKSDLARIYNGEYSLLGDYTHSNVKVEIKHVICGHIYQVRARDLLAGQGCPSCAHNKKRTHREFTNELHSMVCGEYELLSKYVARNKKVVFLHKECGYTYEGTPGKFLEGRRCPKCRESKGERKIREWLTAFGFVFESQKPVKYMRDKPPLKLDAYVQGVAIEYDGEYHYKPMPHAGGEEGLRDQQRRDAIKDKYCADHGIPLIRIPYWDFDNIDAILTEKLLPLLNQTAA